MADDLGGVSVSWAQLAAALAVAGNAVAGILWWRINKVDDRSERRHDQAGAVLDLRGQTMGEHTAELRSQRAEINQMQRQRLEDVSRSDRANAELKAEIQGVATELRAYREEVSSGLREILNRIPS